MNAVIEAVRLMRLARGPDGAAALVAARGVVKKLRAEGLDPDEAAARMLVVMATASQAFLHSVFSPADVDDFLAGLALFQEN